MKKLLTVLLAGLIAMSLMSGCGSKSNENTESNGSDENQVTENTNENENTTAAPVGETLMNAFTEYMNANPEATALDAAADVAANAIIPFDAATMEIEPGFLNGFDNAEITGFEQGVMFAPMMGTIPFVGYIFTLPADADVDAFMNTLKESANLRWNICTEADEMTVTNVENTVFFLMAPMSFEDAQ